MKTQEHDIGNHHTTSHAKKKKEQEKKGKMKIPNWVAFNIQLKRGA